MREQEIELKKQIVVLNEMRSNLKYAKEVTEFAREKERIIRQERTIEYAVEMLQCDPLGTVSSEFLNDEVLISFIQSKNDKALSLWHFIQTNNPDLIEQKIKDILDEYREERNQGFGIPPRELYSSTLIRSVYLSGNAALIDIFKRHLPIPSAKVFKTQEVPSLVANKEREIEQSIKALKDNNPQLSLNEITNKVIKIQRVMRSKLRYQEEIKRISSRSKWKSAINKKSPESLLQNANRPYLPRCKNRGLARRILRLAQQVRLFSTVKHWTSGDHIESIFNDALYGRRNLLASYLPFRPAALNSLDVIEGDGNVICLGPFEIDPNAMKANTIEIRFDLDQLSLNNPAIFYKQRDLGFLLERKRLIPIKSKDDEKPLFFSHTSTFKHRKSGFSHLSVYDENEENIKGYSLLPNYSLISYNLQNIHQILTLNFFRFLDSTNNKNFDSIRDNLYADLEKLNNKQLLKFLKDIGRRLSDTSEFNIYGAHQIDFSTVIALSYYPDGKKENLAYSVKLQELINSLECNDLRMLNRAKTNIPGAFRSYRFLDYLLSKTTSVFGRYELLGLRSRCITPSWIEPVAEPEPLSGELLEQYISASMPPNNVTTTTPTRPLNLNQNKPEEPVDKKEGQGPIDSDEAKIPTSINNKDTSRVEAKLVTPQTVTKPKNTLSKQDLKKILTSYHSTSLLGFLSTLWFFSYFISPRRSQAIIELSLLLSNEEISRHQIIEAIRKDRDGKRRVLLFHQGGNLKNGTSTDDVIDKLAIAFNSRA